MNVTDVVTSCNGICDKWQIWESLGSSMQLTSGFCKLRASCMQVVIMLIKSTPDQLTKKARQILRPVGLLAFAGS